MSALIQRFLFRHFLPGSLSSDIRDGEVDRSKTTPVDRRPRGRPAPRVDDWITYVDEVRDLSTAIHDWSVETVKRACTISDPLAVEQHRQEILSASEGLQRSNSVQHGTRDDGPSYRAAYPSSEQGKLKNSSSPWWLVAYLV